MWEKAINTVVAITLFVVVVFAGIQSIRVSDLSKSVEQYRSEIAVARDSNRRYEETYREAIRTNTEIGECLSEHVSTISELRGQLQTIRAGYEQMQSILENLENSGNFINSSDSDNDSDIGNRSK